jgi:hypothetical protein
LQVTNTGTGYNSLFNNVDADDNPQQMLLICIVLMSVYIINPVPFYNPRDSILLWDMAVLPRLPLHTSNALSTALWAWIRVVSNMGTTPSSPLTNRPSSVQPRTNPFGTGSNQVPTNPLELLPRFPIDSPQAQLGKNYPMDQFPVLFCGDKHLDSIVF